MEDDKKPYGKSDKDDPYVKKALRLLSSNYSEKNARDEKNERMKGFCEDTMSAKPISPRKKIRSKKPWQVWWKTAADLKLLDFQFHGVQRPEWEETLVTEGIGSVMKKAGWHTAFTQKGGTLSSMVHYGDGFKLISASNDSNYPVKFIPIDNTNLYVPTDSTGMRTGTRPARRAAVVFSGTWGEFQDMFPQAKKKKVGVGEIPRDMNFLNSVDTLSASYVRGDDEEEDRIEWCYYFDLDEKIFCVFAGAACTKIELKKGDNYPFYFKDAEGRKVYYIPISHYMCIPALEGFYNHGLIELIYDLAQNDEALFNDVSAYINEIAWPQEFINLPQKRAAKFFKDWQASEEARENGYRAPIPITTDENGKGGEILTRSNIRQGAVGEVMAFLDRQDLELKRAGLYLDEPDGSKSATETLRDIETAKLLNVQIMDWNAEEIEFELMVVLDMLKKLVSPKDKTRLQITTKVKVPDPNTGEMIELKADQVTLGTLHGTVKEHEYFPYVNSKSGSVPSNVMKRAQVQAVLPYLPPGTKEQQGATKEIARINNLDLDFSPLTPAEGVPQGVPGDASTPTPEAVTPISAGTIQQAGLGVPYPSPENVSLTS